MRRDVAKTGARASHERSGRAAASPDEPIPPPVGPTPPVRPPQREEVHVPERRKPRPPRKRRWTPDPRRRIDEYAHP